MLYDLVSPKDPVLKQVIPTFNFESSPINPIDLVANLAETMLENNGIGLAANQCGLSYRVFVILAEEIIPCFNPTIVDCSSEQILLEEGCISYPGLSVKIKRPRLIKVRYTEPNGNVITCKFDGITSRAFQHELDHLNGIVHIERATQLHKEQALKSWKQITRKLKL